MPKRKIIKIDEEKCNGCSLCIPNCPEGALQIIDGKVRLISDLFCDGLGACIGHCPEDAIIIEEREAEPYDEKKVMANIVKQGKNVIKAHLSHLKDHGEQEYLSQALAFLKKKNIPAPDLDTGAGEHTAGPHGGGCPGSQVRELSGKSSGEVSAPAGPSRLVNWPVQLKLVPAFAPFLKNADLLIAADCAPFAYTGFHEELLAGKVLLIGCPKLDDAAYYREKIKSIITMSSPKSITCAHMEVPCCFGLVQLIQSAITDSGKDVPFTAVQIGVKGERQN